MKQRVAHADAKAQALWFTISGFIGTVLFYVLYEIVLTLLPTTLPSVRISVYKFTHVFSCQSIAMRVTDNVYSCCSVFCRSWSSISSRRLWRAFFSFRRVTGLDHITNINNITLGGKLQNFNLMDLLKYCLNFVDARSSSIPCALVHSLRFLNHSKVFWPWG
jgi:hypothetical protein